MRLRVPRAMLPQLQYVKPSDSININDHPCAIFCGSVVCLSAVLVSVSVCLSRRYTAHRDRDILVRTYRRTTEHTGCPGTTGQPECPVYRDSGKPNPGTRYITLLYIKIQPVKNQTQLQISYNTTRPLHNTTSKLNIQHYPSSSS